MTEIFLFIFMYIIFLIIYRQQSSRSMYIDNYEEFQFSSLSNNMVERTGNKYTKNSWLVNVSLQFLFKVKSKKYQ